MNNVKGFGRPEMSDDIVKVTWKTNLIIVYTYLYVYKLNTHSRMLKMSHILSFTMN